MAVDEEAARRRAAIGSALFMVAGPGVVTGLVPWLLTGWRSSDPPLPLAVAGGVLLVTGVAALLYAFARFVVEGHGTPAPVAAPDRLVVGGLYRHVRNPMYLTVTAAILGQALLLASAALALYALAFGAAVFAFVRLYE